MSTGQTDSGGGSTPGQTIVVQPTPVSWIDRGLKIAVIVCMIGGMIFVGTLKQQGKLSDEDAAQAIQAIKTFGPMLMAKAPDGSTTTVATADEKSTVIVKPALSASDDEPRGAGLTPDQWLALITKGAEILKPIINPPGPTPIPGPTPSEQVLIDQIAALKDQIAAILKPPAPTPVDPKPVPVVPVPVPIPGGSKIIVTDEQGKPITSATVEAGVLFQVGSAVAAGNAGWTVSRNGDVKLVTLANDAGYVCYLNPGAWVEFHLIDYGTRQTSVLRITCNQGPQPPPNPKPVDPVPVPTVDVKPTPKPATGLRVLVVYESSQNHSSKQDLILNSVTSGKINDALNARCSKGSDGRPNWRRWDKDIVFDSSSPMGKLWAEVLEPAKSKGLPAIVVTCGDDSTVYPIGPDASEDSVLAVLTCGS